MTHQSDRAIETRVLDTPSCAPVNDANRNIAVAPDAVRWIPGRHRRTKENRLQEKARSACCQIAPFSSTSKSQTTRPCWNTKYIYAFHFVPSDCPTEGFDYNQIIAFDKRGRTPALRTARKGSKGDCPDKFREPREGGVALAKTADGAHLEGNKQTLQP